MITEQDLQEAIAECQGVRNPNANTAIKLAAFLTIQRELFGADQTADVRNVAPAYSYASEPPETYPQYSGADTVGDYGDSDFLQAVKGMNAVDAWAVMDELMETLQAVNPRLYSGVMRRIM